MRTALHVSSTGRVATRIATLSLSLLLAGLMAFISPLGVFASTYSTGVLATTGLKCYYRLDQASGNFTNANSCGNDLTHIGGTITRSQGGAINNDSDTAASFGSNGYASSANPVGWASAMTNLSVEFWVYFPSGRPTNNFGESGLVTYGDMPNCYGGFQFVFASGGLLARASTGVCNPTRDIQSGPVSNGWHMIDYTINGSSLQTLYIDSAVAGQNSNGGLYSGGGGPILYLGNIRVGEGYSDNNSMVTHILDDVSTYTTTLSAATISNHWQSGGPHTPVGPYTLQSAGSAVATVGSSAAITFNEIDSTTYDVTALDSFSLVANSHLTCSAFTIVSGAYYANCSSTTIGEFNATLGSSLGAHPIVLTFVFIAKPASLIITPTSASVPQGTSVTFMASGPNNLINNIASYSAPAGVLCNPVGSDTSQYTCVGANVGTQSITFTDTGGHSATVSLIVTVIIAPPTAVNCAADITGAICWLFQIFQWLYNLPGTIARFLFGDGSGSGVNFAILTNELIPAGTCRTGQTPTAADGVQCIVFPFSTPIDVYNIVSFFNVTPVVPDLGGTLNFTFGPVTIHPVMHLNLGTWGDAPIGGIFGNVSIMDIFKAGEYLALIISLAWATGKVLNVFGIA